MRPDLGETHVVEQQRLKDEFKAAATLPTTSEAGLFYKKAVTKEQQDTQK